MRSEPPPAYQPAPEAQEPAAFQPLVDDEEPTFVAPTRPAPGQPSQEAMQRLQAAVAKQPHVRKPAPAPADEKSRFGINSLIGRMTGSADSSGETQPPQRRQPPVQPTAQNYEADEEQNPDQERIEIPAFLRRQAN